MKLDFLITLAVCVGFGSFAEVGAAISDDAQAAQSAARPYDLNIVAPVQVAGSDAAAKEFQTSVLPGLLAAVSETLPESKKKNVSDRAGIAWDASKLTFATDTSARVYFLGEGVGYQNTLGISTTGGGPLSPDAALIFPNVSTPGEQGSSNSLVRSPSERLVAGDFVDLGTFKAGTALDFFLIASGAAGGKDFYSTNLSLNKDGMLHAVSFAPDGSAYLIVGFEDKKNGGDRDYNDFVFAVQIASAVNTPHVTGLSAPEPSLAAGTLLTGLALLGFRRRRPILSI